MELAPLTVQGLVLLLPIGKMVWKLFTPSVFCLRIGQNSKGVVEERGMIISYRSSGSYFFSPNNMRKSNTSSSPFQIVEFASCSIRR